MILNIFEINPNSFDRKIRIHRSEPLHPLLDCVLPYWSVRSCFLDHVVNFCLRQAIFVGDRDLVSFKRPFSSVIVICLALPVDLSWADTFNMPMLLLLIRIIKTTHTNVIKNTYNTSNTCNNKTKPPILLELSVLEYVQRARYTNYVCVLRMPKKARAMHDLFTACIAHA